MKMGKSDVCKRDKESGKDVKIAEASYPEYDSSGECLEALGEAKLVELVNAQVRTNELNRVRALYTNGPGKKALEKRAADSITAEDFMNCAKTGNPTQAYADLVAQRYAQFEAEAKAQLAGTATESEGN